MRLALYSLRPSLLKELREAIEEFNSTAFLDLETESFSAYDALLQTAAQSPFDALFYDLEENADAEARLLRLRRNVPECSLVLLSDSKPPAISGHTLRTAAGLTPSLDKEEFFAHLIFLLQERSRQREG